MVVAETKRLLLTKVSLEDAPFFVKLMNSPKWIEFIGDRNIRNDEDAKAYLKRTVLKSYEESGFGFYKVILKHDKDKVIGISGLVKREQLREPDIGFGFLPDFEGHGYGLEATREILRLAKEQFKIDRISAITNPANIKSIKLIEKLGLVFQKKVKPFEEDEELLLFAKNL